MLRRSILIFLFARLSPLHAQEISEMRVVGDAELIPTQIIADKVVGRDGKTYTNVAGLMIVSNVDNLIYMPADRIIKIDSKPGEDKLYLKDDAKFVKIFRAGYDSLKINLSDYGIALKKKQVWKLEIAAYRIQKEIRVTVVTEPGDAIALLDSVDMGQDKKLTVLEGVHEIIVKRKGYLPEVDTIAVTASQTTFAYRLKLGIKIKTTPEEATIYIDKDQKVIDGEHAVTPGTHSVLIEKEGYEPINKTIAVSAQQTAFEFTLKKSKSIFRRLTSDFGIGLVEVWDIAQPEIPGLNSASTLVTGLSIDIPIGIKQTHLNWFAAWHEDDVTKFAMRRIGLQKNFHSNETGFHLNAGYLRKSIDGFAFDPSFEAKGVSLSGGFGGFLLKNFQVRLELNYGYLAFQRVYSPHENRSLSGDFKSSSFSLALHVLLKPSIYRSK